MIALLLYLLGMYTTYIGVVEHNEEEGLYPPMRPFDWTFVVGWPLYTVWVVFHDLYKAITGPGGEDE